MPSQRHIVFESYGGVYDQFNVTEAMCCEEWNDISPDTFRKLNAIRTLTGEKLHRLLTDIFQENMTKTNFYYRTGNYFVLEHHWAPVCWIFGQSLYWGEDIPSLWVHLHQTSYVDVIQHIFDHLGVHEITAEFSRDNKKGYWTQELTPLALDIHAPYRFYSPVAIGGESIFNYFRNGILVGCSCSIPHTIFGELTTFFSLMRHSKTGSYAGFRFILKPICFFRTTDGVLNFSQWVTKENESPTRDSCFPLTVKVCFSLKDERHPLKFLISTLNAAVINVPAGDGKSASTIEYVPYDMFQQMERKTWLSVAESPLTSAYFAYRREAERVAGQANHEKLLALKTEMSQVLSRLRVLLLFAKVKGLCQDTLQVLFILLKT